MPPGARTGSGSLPSADNYVSIWDAADGKELTTLRGHEGIVRTLSFSPDGKLILTTSCGPHRASLECRNRRGGRRNARPSGHG